MILSKTISIKPSNKNKNYYTNKGYDTSTNTINVKVEDLPPYSHFKIKVKCDVCCKEKELLYFKYMKNTKNNTIHYACSQKCSVSKLMDTFNKNYGCVSSQHPDIKLKQSKTNNELYGGNSPQCDKSVKQKSYDTMIEKYGFQYSLQNEVIKDKFLANIDRTVEKTIKTKVERGLMVDYNNWDTYIEYRKLVLCETRKHKNKLFNEWNGLDYYDDEYIKDNSNVKDKSYPSIDHKLSILYGFNNQIDPYKIGGINNLCITKRTNNSKKNSKNSI
jgi:hypothetical protein